MTILISENISTWSGQFQRGEHKIINFTFNCGDFKIVYPDSRCQRRQHNPRSECIAHTESRLIMCYGSPINLQDQNRNSIDSPYLK